MPAGPSARPPHLVAGDFDYFLKIRVGDMEDFNRIHGEKLIALPGMRQTRTLLRDEGGRRQRAAGVLSHST
jgi:DNA-binding Lrp family transcriptional regulator